MEIYFQVALNIDIQVKGELNGSIKGGKLKSIGIDTGQSNVIVIFLDDGSTYKRDLMSSCYILRCSKNGGDHDGWL